MGLYRTLAIFLCLLAAPAIGATTTLSVWLDNQTYSLQLTEHLPAGTSSKPSNSDHYKGSVVGVEDSWARISRIDNHWEGVVSLNGQMYIIDLSILTKNSRALHSTVIEAQPASNFSDVGECGMHTKHDSDSSPVSAISLKSRTAQQATFSSLCSSTVDGICLLAEIDFVFDQSFQALYPTTYESRAVELINIVEGYYRNDLNIAFETLSTTFLTSNVFTSSTDSLTVLQDLSSKKDNGSLSFSSKDEALMQLITGKDFDGDTVGVAWLEGLCDTTGYWSTSTAQVVSNIPLTALVSAHEIGHNLGSGHDGTGNSCGSGFIMGPSLNQFASSFSTCSVDYIQDTISGVTNQNSCFNYPFDIEISDENSSDSISTDTTTRTYRIDAATASQSINQTTLSGNITSGSGTITGATIDGNNCSIAGDEQSYSCVLGSPTSNHNLSISLSVSDGSYALTHSVAVNQTDLSETNSDNNTLTDNFNVAIEEEDDLLPIDPDPIIPEEVPAEAPEVATEDTENNIQENEGSGSSQETSNDNSSNSSSGGGGSLGIISILMLSILAARRLFTSKLG